jgi:hypothetical protein
MQHLKALTDPKNWPGDAKPVLLVKRIVENLFCCLVEFRVDKVIKTTAWKVDPVNLV